MRVVHKVDAHIFLLGPSCSPTGNIFTFLWPQSLVALGQSHRAFNKSCTVYSQSALNSGWTTVELPGRQKRKCHTARAREVTVRCVTDGSFVVISSRETFFSLSFFFCG